MIQSNLINYNKQLLLDYSKQWKIGFQLFDLNSDLVFMGDKTPIFFRDEKSWTDMLEQCFRQEKILLYTVSQGVTLVVPITIKKERLGGALIHLSDKSLTDMELKGLLPPDDSLNDLHVVIKKIKGSDTLAMQGTFFLTLCTNYLAATVAAKQYEQAMESLKNEINQAENKLAQFEIQSLEKQIKPHFLFNTLNLVARLVYLEKSAESIEVVYALSKMLRYSMEKKELVRVRDELQYIKNYLFIQKNRYDDQLNYQLDISENILGGLIPALSLQPLVENSIKHGLEPKGGGFIKIVGRLVEGKMVISVIDNGLGFHSSEGKEGSSGTGLNSISKRVKFYFGEDVGLDISSKPDEETMVTLSVPFKSDMEDRYVPVFWFDK